MKYLQQTLLGNTLLAWSLALIAACAALALIFLFQRVILRRLAAYAETSRTELDDLVVAVLNNTKLFTVLAIALYTGSQRLILGPRWEQACKTGFIVLMLLQGAIWANTAVSFILERTIQRRTESDAGGTTNLNALGFLSKLAVWSIFLLMVLDNLGVNVTGLVTGLGIGGIAVALSLQKILGDLFASLSIVLDKPFEVGDFIVIGDFLGVVKRIGLKTTRIKSLSGEQIVFSNSDLLGSRIRNFKRMEERRVVFSLRVTFQTPHGKLAAIPGMIRDIVESQKSIRFDRAHFKEFGNTALLFEVVYFLLNPDMNLYMDIQQAINLEIVRRFESEGIALVVA